ncbi:putative membrane protein [Bacteroides intestinalis CAG:315]|nr:putative membrane protein [Bacteroides intestinalis CAG:315]
MLDDLMLLYISLVVWICFLIYSIKKYGINKLGIYYFIVYALSFFLAIDLFKKTSGRMYEDLNLFSNIFLIIILYFFARPLMIINPRKMPLKHLSLRKENILCCIIIFFSLLSLGDVITNFFTGFSMMLVDESYGASLYRDLRYGVNFDSKSSSVSFLNLFGVVSNVFKAVSPLFCLYYLTRKDRNLFITIGLFIAMLMDIMSGISTGSRLRPIATIMNIGGLTLFLYPFYSATVKKMLSVSLITVFSITVIGVCLITMSRIRENKTDIATSIESYASQSYLNFSKYAFDANGCRYGDKTFPLIKRFFTDDVARGYTERLEKYKKMRINESNFIPFVGDFMLDYGPIGGPVFLLFFIIFFNRKINRLRVINLGQLSLIYLLIVILNGFYQYPLSDYLGNLQFLFLILLYVYFKSPKHYKQV